MKKRLQLDSISQENNSNINYINSEFTQMLENQINFVKDNIVIDEKGFIINQQKFEFPFKNEIHIEKKIGSGNSSVVHLVSFKSNPDLKLAMKTINLYDKQSRAQLINDLKNYLDIQKECKFLLNFYGAFFEQGSVKMFLEYMDGGNLKDAIYNKKKQGRIFTENEVKYFVENILHGISYIHILHHRVHLDLKPENILIDKKKGVKISDFGICKNLEHSLSVTSTFKGTISYMSPERLCNRAYSFNADIWSLGVIALEIVLLEYPFQCKSFVDLVQFFQGKNKLIQEQKVLKNYSSNLLNFLSLCLQKDETKRPQAADLLTHKWFFINQYIRHIKQTFRKALLVLDLLIQQMLVIFQICNKDFKLLLQVFFYVFIFRL